MENFIRPLRHVASFLVKVVKDFGRDNGTQMAAAIAYYSLLSIFPLLLAAVSIAAYFVDPKWAVNQATRFLGNYLPKGADQIRNVVTGAIQNRGGVGLGSIALLLWSGSRVFGAVTKGLNIAMDVEDNYGFFKRILIELIMTLSVGILFLAALLSRLLIQFIWRTLLPDGSLNGFLGNTLMNSIQTALLFLSFYLIYLHVPRTQVSRKAALVGSAVTTAVFLAARPLFLYYISVLANYNLIYGPIAIVIIINFWAWLVATMLLLGGEIVGQLQVSEKKQ